METLSCQSQLAKWQFLEDRNDHQPLLTLSQYYIFMLQKLSTIEFGILVCYWCVTICK